MLMRPSCAVLLMSLALLTGGCGGGGGGGNQTAGPSLEVTPDSLDFGAVPFGTSASQSVTVRNVGATQVTGFSGGVPDDARFSLVSSCIDLAPGSSCAYLYTFEPTANGRTDATSTTATSVGDFDVALTGAGVGSPLWVTPLVLDFGPVGVGVTSPTQTVTITNQGSATLGGFAGGAPFNTQFGASQNCAGGVAPGASCQYFFTFTPSETGFLATTSNSFTNAGPFIIELMGTGVGSELWFTPSSIDFGPVEIGNTSATRTVTITNTGKSTLASFAGGAPFNNRFGASQNCAGGVAPGASCQYFFTFAPDAIGAIATTSNSSTNAGPFVIELTGTGVAPGGLPVSGPGLSVSPLALDFGPVGVGVTSAPQVVTITNTGDATLTSFAGGAPFDTQFNAVQNCAGGVAPGSSCQYTFRFTPAAAGAASTTSNSSTNAGPFIIGLSGTGVGSALWVTPQKLDFGTVTLGAASPTQPVTISNTGLALLTDFAGGAPFDTQFSATQNCAGGVAPGDSCQYTFRFTPNVAVEYSESESVSSTNAGQFTIELQGGSLAP